MTFRVGQIVECINASVGFGSGRPVPLTLHAKYTINNVDGKYLLLAGLGIMWLAAIRFRPIVERKTDISIFTKMLTPEGVDA